MQNKSLEAEAGLHIGAVGVLSSSKFHYDCMVGGATLAVAEQVSNVCVLTVPVCGPALLAFLCCCFCSSEVEAEARARSLNVMRGIELQQSFSVF